MKCPDDGGLRAHLDRQLVDIEEMSVKAHLLVCAACEARLGAIRARAEEVDSLLAAPAEPALDPRLAYDRFQRGFAASAAEAAGGTDGLWKGNRPILGGLAAAACLAILFSFAPAQSAAQKFLQLLRVQKLTVLPLDLSSATQIGGKEPGRFLTQLISDNVVVTMEPGQSTRVASADEAAQTAGFKLRTLDGAGPVAATFVSGEAAFHLTLNRDRMQAVLDQAGRSDIHVPESIDGSTVAVHIPKAVRISYGNCADKQNGDAPVVPGSAGGGTCITFVQAPTPAVSVPPNLDIASVAEAALQITGMSAAEAHAFTQTVDWSTTIVIPVPQGESSYRSLPVDGVTGTLMERPPKGNFRGDYVLLWLKNGMIYAVEGRGASSQALAAVASLG